MNTKNNQRYKDSADKIETTFLTLILKQKYEDIQISDLCKKAGINRSTFYAHYKDINELVVSIEAKFEKGIASILDYGLKLDLDSFIEMFNFVKEYRFFYKAFLSIPYRSIRDTGIKEDVLKHLKENKKTTKYDETYIFYRTSFFSAGIKEIFRLWLNRDCKESPEEMAKLIIKEFRG